MKLIYVDKYGQSMEMETEDQNTFEIPVMIREYKKFDMLSIFINPDRKYRNQEAKNKKKRADEYTYINCSMLFNDPFDIEDWHLSSAIPEEWTEKFESYWLNTAMAYQKNFMSYNPVFISKGTNLGDEFFFKNVIIADLENMTIHAFGSCLIKKPSLKNVLIYLHGDENEIYKAAER